MKKDKAKQSKNKYQASRFWLGRDFDITTNIGGRNVDYTKLAATQRAIGNFVNIVTGQQIPVIFQNAEQSFTDGQTVVIGTKLEGNNFDPAVGLALHEGSHIAFTDFTMFKTLHGHVTTSLHYTKMADVVRKNGYDPNMDLTDKDFMRIKDLLNWIEDRRIDYKIYTNAPGYRMYYEAMYDKYFNDKVIDKALRGKVKNQETWDDYMFHVINFTNPNRKLKTLKRLREIWDVIDLKNIQRLQTTEDALLISCKVWSIINQATAGEKAEEITDVKNVFVKGGMIDDDNAAPADSGSDTTIPVATTQPDTPESDEDSDESKEDSDVEVGKGAGNEDSDSDEDSESGSNGTGEDDDEGDVVDTSAGVPEEGPVPELTAKERADLEKAIAEQRKFIAGNIKKTGRLTKTQSRLVRAIRESGTETRTVYTDVSGTMDPIEAVVIKKMTASVIACMPSLFQSDAVEFLNGRKIDVNTYRGRKIQEMHDAVSRGLLLGRQLGSRLQLRNAEKSLKTTRLQTGKIDRRLVAQLGYDNANVFHRIVTDRFKNYFIHISIDASGSMDSGYKFQNAITSAIAIAQAASMTTGIRVQISLRGTERLGGDVERCVTLYAYDSAHDKMSKIRNYFRYLSTFGCTPEGLAFKSIEPDLLRDAKGDECIFINYSDGEPTTIHGVSRGYDGVTFTQRVVMSMRANAINVISYFIHCGGVYQSTRDKFCKMYGADASFIDPNNMNDVAKTMNRKFLEMAM